MSILEKKVTQEQLDTAGFAKMPDKIVGEPKLVKQHIDGCGNVAAHALNELIDALSAASGAGEIGAVALESGAGGNVQSNLTYLLEKLNAHKNSGRHVVVAKEMPAQLAVGDVWLQELGDAQGRQTSVIITNAEVSEVEIGNKENLWLNT